MPDERLPDHIASGEAPIWSLDAHKCLVSAGTDIQSLSRPLK